MGLTIIQDSPLYAECRPQSVYILWFEMAKLAEKSLFYIFFSYYLLLITTLHNLPEVKLYAIIKYSGKNNLELSQGRTFKALFLLSRIYITSKCHV